MRLFPQKNICEFDGQILQLALIWDFSVAQCSVCSVIKSCKFRNADIRPLLGKWTVVLVNKSNEKFINPFPFFCDWSGGEVEPLPKQRGRVLPGS